jgi:non-specific serine/threonine protein kinase
MSSSQVIAGRYRIDDPKQDLLGRGGMGDVYRATDTETGETVAVKALNPAMVALDPSIVERFLREGEALRQLNHPNIVRMLAAVEEAGRHYLIMEYVVGGSLQDLLSAGPLPTPRILEIALDLADALTRAHRLGIIHRDLKPANVLLAADGSPRLADFGIAHVDAKARLTETGLLMGTVDYLSPEACKGEALDERADIWAFGVMLYEMASGRLPFAGDSLVAKITAILGQPVPDLGQLCPGLPAALVDLVSRMLEKDRQLRIPSIRLVGAELDAMRRGDFRVPGYPTSTASAIATPRSPAAVPGQLPVAHNLPVQPGTFIGRDDAIATATALLATARLVTLIGPGGIGKTRLALQIAASILTSFSDGVWLVELAPLSNPDLIPHSVASALGLREIPGVALPGLITDYLRSRHLLLLLDNCEHLVEACARFADQLLRASPRLQVIATSREALGIAGEVVYAVPPLTTPEVGGWSLDRLSQYEGIQLFVERASAAERHFVLTEENAPAVIQICRRLDGIPLAIELAASRIQLFTPEQIATRLDDRFRLLASGGRTAAPRQKSLRALMDWSHDLLSDSERAVFRQLSVFAGGWSFEAAEAVYSDSSVLDLLAALVNKSLVVVEHGADENRYRFLETMRQFAREKLEEAGESGDSRDRHLHFFLALVEAAEPKLQGSEMMSWLDRLAREQDNLRAALERAIETDVMAALAMTAGLWFFWSRRGSVSEGLAWVGSALDRAEAMTQALAQDEHAYLASVARALAAQAALEFDHGDSAASSIAAERSVALARPLNLSQTLAFALGMGAKAKLGLGHVEVARGWAQESYTLSLARGYWFELGLALSALHLAADANTLANLQLQQMQALPLLRKGGNPWMLALNMFDSAIVSELSGDLNQAVVDFEEASKVFDSIWDRQYYTASRSMQAHFLRRHGRLDEATAIYRETIGQWQELGHVAAVAHQLECFAYMASDQGQARRACVLLATATSVREARSLSMFSDERDEYDRGISRLQAELGPTGFEAAWAEGEALTLEQAVKLALV